MQILSLRMQYEMSDANVVLKVQASKMLVLLVIYNNGFMEQTHTAYVDKDVMPTFIQRSTW
jgi:hypothetical protein